MVTAREGFSLVGVIDVENDGKTLHEVDTRFTGVHCPVFTDISGALRKQDRIVLSILRLLMPALFTPVPL